MKLDIFITGGTGFIGRWLLLELTRQGKQVGVLKRESSHNGHDLLQWIDHHGGNSRCIQLINGDMRKPQLGLSADDQLRLQQIKDIYNLAGLTGWGLDYEAARQVNVKAPVDLIQIAAQGKHLRRFVQITGYKAGTGRQGPHALGFSKRMQWGESKWKWYARYKGVYHGTKMEAHYAVQKKCRQYAIPFTIINPGTLIGNSTNGEIEMTQSDNILSIMNQLLTGKLTAIPGNKKSWLPLVPVDYLAAFMAGVCELEETANQAYWILAENSPDLGSMIHTIGDILDVKSPAWHMPVWLMRSSLRAGLSKLLGLSHEGLEYIISHRFNVTDENQLARLMKLDKPDINQALQRTVHYFKEIILEETIRKEAFV